MNSVAIPECLSGVKWKVLPRVKLFHAHRLRKADGTVIDVDNDRLQRIVAQINRKGIVKDQWPTFSEDHIVTYVDGKQVTKPSGKIKILGYTVNYDTETDAKGERWIVADHLAFPDQFEAVKSLPFRSVEFHPHNDLITNVAWTKHTPQLDVGAVLPHHWEKGCVTTGNLPSSGPATSTSRLVAYTHDNTEGGVVIYSLEGADDMDNNTLLQGLSTLRKAVSDLIEKVGAEATPTPTPTPAPTGTISYEASPEFQAMKKELDELKAGKATAEEVANKLASEKRAMERKVKLTELAKTKKVDVDAEIKVWGDKPDDVFTAHCDTIVNCYAARSAGGAVIEPLDGPGGSGSVDSDLMRKAQKITSSRIQKGDDSMQFMDVFNRLKAEPAWNGQSN